MVDLDALKKEIELSGMTMVAISKKTGILRETLYNRLNGIGEFTASEITALSRVLHFTRSKRDKIFLTEKLS